MSNLMTLDTKEGTRLPWLDWRHGYQCVAVAKYSGLQCSATASFLLHGEPVCGHHTNPDTTETKVWK